MNVKELSGQLYVVTGSAMLLMSVLIDYEKLMLFILAGAVFIVIGFFKLVMKSGEEKHKQRKANHKTHTTHKRTHHESAHKQIIRCRNCHVKIHPSFKFCPNCGQKLFMAEHHHKTQHHKHQ